MKKMILTVFAVCMCLWFIFASAPGPKLVNINSRHQNLSVKTKDIQPRSDVKTVQPDIDFGKIPLYFIANKGQVNGKAKFYAKTSRYTLWMMKQGLMFDSIKIASADEKVVERDVTRMLFIGANTNPGMVAVDKARLKVNYFIGSDKSKWNCGVPTSMAVLYKDLYKNIDMKVYGIEKQIEYDWLVKAGGNPMDIRFQYTDVRDSRIDKEGNLLIETVFGELIHKKPFSYQVVKAQGQKGSKAEKQIVEVGFKKVGKNTYGFAVGDYDKNRDLVIDPVILVYSTFFGGSGGDHLRHITIDDDGYLYVTGLTQSPDFPATNSYLGGWSDAYIAKIDYPEDSPPSLLYCTYLGGVGLDAGNRLTLDANGFVYIVGDTSSSNFPQVNSYQGYKGGYDAFIVKLDLTPNGSGQLLFSSLLGGNAGESTLGVEVDANGCIYVGGTTGSPDFPKKNHYQGDSLYSDDAFVFKLNPSLNGSAQLLYSTYIGGSEGDYGMDMTVDAAGCIYLVGYTYSNNFPTKNQFQNNQPTIDGFFSKFDPTKSGAASLLCSSYLGGNGEDSAQRITLDSASSVYVVGNTASSNFPTMNQYQGDQPNVDTFITRFDLTGSGSPQLLYSTYLGGAGLDVTGDVVLDGSGKVYVLGFTNSVNFPVLGEIQGYKGNNDMYVTVLDTALSGTSQLLYSTYIGGSQREICTSMALDSMGNAYVTGITISPDYPIENPYQGNLNNWDGVITKLSFGPLNEPPVANCKDVKIAADENCKAFITAADVDGGSYDPDVGDDITLSLDNTGPFSIGPHPVKLTVTDQSGESDFCYAEVIVTDQSEPVILLSNPILTQVGNGKNGNGNKTGYKLSLGAWDNCSGSAVDLKILKVEVFNNSGNLVNGQGISDVNGNDIYVYPKGNGWSVEVTVEAEDANGNKVIQTISKNLP